MRRSEEKGRASKRSERGKGMNRWMRLVGPYALLAMQLD